METKVCTGCGIDKRLSNYSRGGRAKSGLKARCKACVAAYVRSSRTPHPHAKGVNSSHADSFGLGKYITLTDYCDKCKKIVKFYKMSRGKAYICSDCKRHLYYQAGTLFEKSHTPLSKWTIAYILLHENNKDVSAKEIERSIDVTYKTAWRIKKLLLENWKEAGEFLELFNREEHFKDDVHESVAGTIYYNLTKPRFKKNRRHRMMNLTSIKLTDEGMKVLGKK